MPGKQSAFFKSKTVTLQSELRLCPYIKVNTKNYTCLISLLLEIQRFLYSRKLDKKFFQKYSNMEKQ